MDNGWVLFNARFNGTSQEVAVPFTAVIGIFAKETGYGMGFQPTLDATEADEGQPLQIVSAADEPLKASEEMPPVAAKSKSKVSHLKVIK